MDFTIKLDKPMEINIKLVNPEEKPGETPKEDKPEDKK